MGDSLDDPALQLFHLELQELMEQVGFALAALTDSASSADYKSLCRSLRLMHQGAVQMNLEVMEQRTSEFLKILLPVSNVPEEDLSSSQIEALIQLFRELQTIALVPSRPLPEFNAESHELNEAEMGSTLPESGEVSGVSHDIRQVLLQNDIASVMTQLEQSLTQLTGASLVADLVAKVDALQGWGEVLDWPEWVALSSAIAQGLEAHPEAAPSLASVGLLGFQALYQSAVLEEHRLVDGATEPLLSPEEIPADQFSFVFATAHKFIWQSQQVIFALDSTAIAETLIPQKTQVMSQETQRLLLWNQQRVPILSLTSLLTDQWRPDWGRNPVADSGGKPSSSPGPVIVISTSVGMMALEIEMEQFIRVPELGVCQISPAPPFLLGRTSVKDQGDFVLIDVLELLALSPPQLTSTPDHLSPTTLMPNVEPVSPSIAQSTLVLVVDDSRVIRYILRRTFEQSSYSVILAQDGLEAIQKLQQYPEIALMVSDVEMPNLNGFELLSRCRRESAWQDLPIIILSQCSTEQHQQLALQFGANAYVSKPFDDDDFLATVASLLVT